jgi:hypothetical protein
MNSDSAQTIIQEMRQLGMQVQADPDAGKVRFGPSEAMPWELRLRLREHKGAVLALLTREASEIAWRVAAMRPQVRANGPIPFLTARAFPWRLEDAQAAVNGLMAPRCLSCGDPVDETRRPRCTPCAEAAMIVMNETREEVTA